MLTFTKLVLASAFLLSVGTQAAPAEKRATVNPPKVGYELENRKISLKNQNPDITSTSHDASALKEAIKGMPISIPGITQNPRWALTAETEGTGLTTLTPEIIVDGGVATQRRGVPLTATENVGAAVGQEITDFVKQWFDSWPNGGRLVKIEDMSVRPSLSPADITELQGMTWSAEAQIADPATLEWGIQATAPFPLEKLQELLPSYSDDARSFTQKSPLVQNGKLAIIERCYIPFKSNKKRVDWNKQDGSAQAAMDAWTENEIDDEVLGYLSLVLGYIRGTKTSDASKGLKHSTSVMPRTDFKAMYRELGIKAKVEDIVDKIVDNRGGSIAHWHDAAVQQFYPRTRLDKGAPLKTLVYAICRLTQVCDKGDDFDKIQLKWQKEGKVVGPMVSRWLDDLDNSGSGIDLVSLQDQERHGQIGGLKDTFERVIGGTKKLPIFEFRDLMSARTNDISKKLGDIETEIKKHHSAVRTLSKRAVPKKTIKKNKYCYKVRARPTSTSTTATATSTNAATKTTDTTKPTQTSNADKKKELEEKLAAKKAEKESIDQEKRKKLDNKKNGGSGKDKDKDFKCNKLKGAAKLACLAANAADAATDVAGIVGV